MKRALYATDAEKTSRITPPAHRGPSPETPSENHRNKDAVSENKNVIAKLQRNNIFTAFFFHKNFEVTAKMTGRHHLNVQVFGLLILFVGTLAAWFWALLCSEAARAAHYAFAIPLTGLALGAFYHTFLIRCPWCGKRLGYLLRSPSEFSLFRFSKRVRFCPACTLDFQDDLHTRHGAHRPAHASRRSP